MKRSLTLSMVIGILAALACEAQAQPAGAAPGAAPAAAPTGVDAADREAAALELDLVRFKDTSPEAADILAKMVDLYYSNGRVFGLVRTGQKFIALHGQDKRHKDVYLKLLDGLEALSRNEELISSCRQFLERYPSEPQSAAIEVRLARTLERMPDAAAGKGGALNAATAWQAVWRRQTAAPAGRQAGVRAIAICEALKSAEAVKLAAELAGEMIEKLPAGPLTGEIGARVFTLLCVNQPPQANTLANKMLAKGGITDKRLLRDVHARMAANYLQLRQYANAAASLRKALAIEDNAELQSQLIAALSESGAAAAEVEAAVNPYLQKYPKREDRYDRQACVARAYETANDKARALAAYRALLPLDPLAADAARRVVALSDLPAGQAGQAAMAQVEQLLLDSIQKCPKRADYVTFILATEIYDQRMKNRAKARQVIRERLMTGKGSDSYTAAAGHWLLQSAPDEAEFRTDVDRLVELRRQSALGAGPAGLPDYAYNGGRCDYLGGALPALKADPKKKAQATYLETAIRKLHADGLLGPWFTQRSCGGTEPDENIRNRMLKPGTFEKLPRPMQILILSEQVEYVRYQSGRRPQFLSAYSQWAKLAPTDYRPAAGWFVAAYDDTKYDLAKEAVQALLKIDPPATALSQSLSLGYRLMGQAEHDKDRELGQKAYAWIRKAAAAAGQPIVDARIGDSLKALGLEKEALEYWKSALGTNADDPYVYECAARVRKASAPAERAALDKPWLAASLRLRGQYGSWVADDCLTAKDYAGFEKVLRDLIASERERVARRVDVDAQVVNAWIDFCGDEKNIPPAERKLVLSVIRDLDAGSPSAAAHVILLEAQAEKLAPMERFLAYQAATRMLNNDWSDWQRMMPLAQALMEKKQYGPASALLTGLLAHATRVEESRRDSARGLVAQCYAQMGQVGMVIDEKSPLAPLLRAALYLRLGDQRLAFEAVIAHRSLLAARRLEVPADLLIFACDRLVAAGGEDNLADVETWLREWIIRNGESKQFDDDVKAQVQLLLARGYFRAQRYDVARAEFTTVINRFPTKPQAMEAQFGIGETHLAQKVYDQALAIFDKLAQSRESEVVVRAEFLRGVVAFQRGEVEEARNVFRAVLDRVPSIEVADKALFRLSEIYGLEQRYLEQLTLLRTVGRLGRSSKRSHVPGQPLAIVVYDSDLGISRGHNRIPVIVTTDPGGDKELVYLTSAGAGKGLFRADLDTRLGQAVPHNRILELTGRDTIRCDYPEEFRAQFRRVPLSNVQIQIASDGKIQMASTKEFEEKKVTFSEELQKEVDQPKPQADQRVSQVRPINQVKPGNPIYVRVTDMDRDLGNEPDPLVVKVAADSGDQVQAVLQETGPHTGVFEGMIKTSELPAGATASDAAIGHPAILAIDRDPKTFWQSEPDGRTPKTLTVDMKDLKRVTGVRLAVPDPANRAPVRVELQGSYDGVFFFRLGGHPTIEQVEPVAGAYGQMTRRVYAGDYTRLAQWRDVVELTQKAKAIEEQPAEELTWTKPKDPAAAPAAGGGRGAGEKAPHAAVFHGKLVQRRAGAARFQVAGARTALVIDGRAHLPLGEGGRRVDVWLSAGTHDVTVFAAAADAGQAIGATWARADLSTAKVVLHPFQPTDFDLTITEARTAGTPAPEAELKRALLPIGSNVSPVPGLAGDRAERNWDFRFPPADLRYVALVVHEYVGDAVAIGQVEVFGEGEKGTEQFIPPKADLVALANNQELEIAGGDTITATYVDERVPGDSGRPRVLTANLTATYFNADVSPITYGFAKADEGGVRTRPRRVLRIEPGERFVVQIRDYDEDRSNDPDTVPFEIVVNDGKPIALTATETQPNSGVFTKEIDTAAAPTSQPSTAPAASDKDKIAVKPGDRIFCRYRDKQNTFPGHGVFRENVVLINEPTPGRMRILDTLVQVPAAPRAGSKTSPEAAAAARKAPPVITYRRPPEGRDVSYVALAGPMTVEVIDPDAAKDADSTVTISLTTSDGVKLAAHCVLPPDRQSGRQGNDDALTEGRFVGQVMLQLGGKDSPDVIPLTPGMPRLMGGPVVEDQPDKEKEKGLPTTVKVLNVGGKALIQAAYTDQRRPDGKTAELTGKARMIENGQLDCTDQSYERPVEQLYLGERLYVRVIDPDQDTTDQRDTVAVEITSTSGEQETVSLEETLPHSGVFTGSFLLSAAAKPTPGNFLNASQPRPASAPAGGNALAGTPQTRPAEPTIEAFFGDTVRAAYRDKVALTETGELEVIREVPVALGTNGLMDAFSKAFRDEKLSVETRFTIAESHFELFKSHRKLDRREEAKADLQAGRAVLRELIEEQLDPQYTPRVAYLLGQFAQELAQWDEAINAYQSILRQYGEHPLAPDAQYKLAQCYEEMGDFDLALEAYVALAATYPKSPLVASVMIRVADHFYKKEQFDVAAQVGEKFVEKFETNPNAPRMAFRVGQCRYKAGKFTEAGKAFDRFARVFGEDKLCADALFWAGESYRMGKDNRSAYQHYNRCRWDFPASEAAKYARGRLALPEMLSQFEADSKEIENPNEK